MSVAKNSNRQTAIVVHTDILVILIVVLASVISKEQTNISAKLKMENALANQISREIIAINVLLVITTSQVVLLVNVTQSGLQITNVSKILGNVHANRITQENDVTFVKMGIGIILIVLVSLMFFFL